MSYIGSYVWKIRQKIGHDVLITATVDCVVVRDKKVCLVYNKDFERWTLPAGHVELEDSWQSAIQTEIAEEAGIIARTEDLIPFGTVSGPAYKFVYPNQDQTRPFTVVFYCDRFEECNFSDGDEIADKKWVSFDDLKNFKLTTNADLILKAFQEYQKTGKFQQIVME